jgi:hypothetical protein
MILVGDNMVVELLLTFVGELDNGTLYGKSASFLERMDILGHETLLVVLDEQGQFTWGVWGRDGSIRADDWLALWVV